jgi:hypothetical protein
MCRTNGECPGKHCVIQTCPDGHLYELCGAYTGGSAEGGALQCAPQ